MCNNNSLLTRLVRFSLTLIGLVVIPVKNSPAHIAGVNLVGALYFLNFFGRQ